MPTVICLDLSLSMCQLIPGSYVPGTSTTEMPTKHSLAVQCVNQFLDHLSAHSKLEFVALIAYSRLYEKICEFSRDFEKLKTALKTVKHFEKTNFEALLLGISDVVISQWGITPVQIVVVTDGSTGFGPGSLKETIKTTKPFAFPCKMNILCLNDSSDKNFSENYQLLQKLIEISCGDGQIYLPENSVLNSKGCSQAVSKLCAKDFTPYKGTLTCGKLSSMITLCPPPHTFICRSDEKRFDICETINVIGLISSEDLASPPSHSRHLVLPLRPDLNANPAPSPRGNLDEPDDDSDGKLPNFCVMLHGALKIENMCALCEIGPEWYGFLYSWADSKKKSNLMLSILPPGTDVVPWLGNLEQLGPKEELLAQNKYIPFRVKLTEKKTYSTNPTVWLNTQALSSDIQKILRNARKLPEKTAQFYKELNRMRRWALTLGFPQVLESIALVLEHESMISTSTHPDCQIQLTHAASQIRLPLPYSKNIFPAKR